MMQNDSLMGRLRALVGGVEKRRALNEKGIERLRGQLRECAAGQGAKCRRADGRRSWRKPICSSTIAAGSSSCA